MSRCPLALTLLLASLSAQACELPPPPAGRPDVRPPALPAPLYHASKLGQDPRPLPRRCSRTFHRPKPTNAMR